MTAPRHLIVFGDDGSPSADVVWLWLNSHGWAGWQVNVVHAVPPDPRRLTVSAEAARLHPWDPPQRRNAFAEADFGAVSQLTATGDPRLVLRSCRDATLLVIGPRGPGLLKQLHLGSTAEWLLARPPAPLVIVKSARRVRRALACMDGSPDAWRAVEALAAMPWVADTAVSVLGAPDHRADVPAAVAAAAAYLEPLARSVETQTVDQPATLAIHEVLQAGAADLVALGTRGHTGLKHLTLGSTASSVARAARCTVLVATEHPADDAHTADD